MSTARLFADDTMIYLAEKSEQDSKTFQNDIAIIGCLWENMTMEFHPDKCELISITRKRNPAQYPYVLNGHQLKHVDVVKYLGVQISHDLHCDKHIDYITSKANYTLGFLRRNINISTPQIKKNSYKTLVRPILEYSRTVWDPYITAVQQVKAVQ